MKTRIALITGASSGIGRDIAFELAKKKYNLIITARNEEKLNEIKKEIEEKYKVSVNVKVQDLSKIEELSNYHKEIFDEFGMIDILVNNAGFGLFGKFYETDLEKEISMINTNITPLHILTKLFLKDMIKVNEGHILNVASIASFMPAGPLMSTYYATKKYVLSLDQAINKELKVMNSNVKVSTLCPGPVDTNFNNVAGVNFSLKSQTSKEVARIAVEKMFKGKEIICTSKGVAMAKFFSKILPDNLMTNICYNNQKKKE